MFLSRLLVIGFKRCFKWRMFDLNSFSFDSHNIFLLNICLSALSHNLFALKTFAAPLLQVPHVRPSSLTLAWEKCCSPWILFSRHIWIYQMSQINIFLWIALPKSTPVHEHLDLMHHPNQALINQKSSQPNKASRLDFCVKWNHFELFAVDTSAILASKQAALQANADMMNCPSDTVIWTQAADKRLSSRSLCLSFSPKTSFT